MNAGVVASHTSIGGDAYCRTIRNKRTESKFVELTADVVRIYL